MSDSESLPRIVSLNATEPGTIGEQLVQRFRTVRPLVQFGAKFSNLADRTFMSEGHCLMYFHRRVANVREATARVRRLFGRRYNSMTGFADACVALTRPVFSTILRATGEAGLDEARRAGDCALRLDVPEKLLTRFPAIMRQKGIVQ